MSHNTPIAPVPTVLVTGGGVRLGAEICRTFAQAGWRVLCQYRRSADAAQALCQSLRGIGAGDRGDILIVERCDAVIDGPRIDERIVTPRRHRGRKRRRGRRSVDRPREVSPAAVGVRLAVVCIQQHAPTRDGLAAQRHVELVPLLRAAPALVERGDLRIVEPHRHQLALDPRRSCQCRALGG